MSMLNLQDHVSSCRTQSYKVFILKQPGLPAPHQPWRGQDFQGQDTGGWGDDVAQRRFYVSWSFLLHWEKWKFYLLRCWAGKKTSFWQRNTCGADSWCSGCICWATCRLPYWLRFKVFILELCEFFLAFRSRLKLPKIFQNSSVIFNQPANKNICSTVFIPSGGKWSTRQTGIKE